MLGDSLKDIVKSYSKVMSLSEQGLYPGNILEIYNLTSENTFLIKVVMTVQGKQISKLENIKSIKKYTSNKVDGIYYVMVHYNHNLKRYVTTLEFTQSLEFLPLDTYNLDWICRPCSKSKS